MIGEGSFERYLPDGAPRRQDIVKSFCQPQPRQLLMEAAPWDVLRT
jgi:hypothetical protein